MGTVSGCYVCGWSPESDGKQPFESYGLAKESAVKHVDDTGHRVFVRDVK